MEAALKTDSKARILVVDDERTVREVCAVALRKMGHDVTAVEDAVKALRLAQEEEFDIVLTDIRMPGVTGDTLIEQLKSLRPDLCTIIMTGFPTMELAIDAVGKGVYEFVTKPFRLEELRAAVDKALARRADEILRPQRRFAEALLAMEAELGDGFRLVEAVEALLGPSESDTSESGLGPSSGTTAPLVRQEGAAKEQLDPGKPIHVIVCESIPEDRSVLKKAPNYGHFRTIYASLKVLNRQMQEAQVACQAQISLANHSADIPKFFRHSADQICCVIFGPNLPMLSEATVRMMANGGSGRLVVVCHNPDQVKLTRDQLEKMGGTMDVRFCRAVAPTGEVRQFWSHLFTQDLMPLIEGKLESPDGPAAAQEPLTVEEIRQRLSRDEQAVELLPGFPHICRQALEAMEAGARYAEVAKIIEPDGALQASIIRTANVTHYGAKRRIETLPNALTMIGIEETRKIVMGRSMGALMERVSQAGFDTKAFFYHSTAVGYLAQLLRLNFENPSSREKEIIEGLRLPNYVAAALQTFRYWQRFAVAPQFDCFTAGILHDTGKVLNTVCYPEIFPMILYEYERSRWKGSLLQSEVAVVGDLQHPVTSGALLERWEVFPELIEPVREHHRIHADSRPEAALVALANCLSKGLHAFPRTISISAEYREAHLDAVADPDMLVNPLTDLYQTLVGPYETAKQEMDLSSEEMDSGEYEGEHVEALIGAAKEATNPDSAAIAAYVEALIDQNPEFLDLQEWTDSSPEDLLSLSLLLKDYVSSAVNGLFQGPGKQTQSKHRAGRTVT